MISRQTKSSHEKVFTAACAVVAVVLFIVAISFFYLAMSRADSGFTPGNFPILGAGSLVASGIVALTAHNFWKQD